MTHDEHAGFIRSIIESPGCDLPRLVYADWLDENAGVVECKCERCRGNGFLGHPAPGQPGFIGAPKCPVCGGSGTGTVSNGYAERAEFIRVQCELAGTKCGHCNPGFPCPAGGQCRKEPLRQRDRELLAGIRPSLLATLPIDSMKSHAIEADGVVKWDAVQHFTVSRGFVARVTAPLAVLVGGECERCGGAGETDYYRHDGGDYGIETCPSCKGTGRTTGIAAEIIKSQPVMEWVASDKEPAGPMTHNGKDVWAWDSDYGDASRLPEDVHKMLKGGEPYAIRLSDGLPVNYLYPTRELALAALSTVIGQIARGEVKQAREPMLAIA